MGVEGSNPRGGDGSGGDDAHGPATSLRLVEEGVGRFSVIAKAESASGAGLTCGEERGEGGGISGELIGGLAFHECHGVCLIEAGEAAAGFPSLGQSKKLRTGAGNEKDDDTVGASTDEVTDVAIGEANEGEEDAKGEKLRSPPFCSHLPSKAERAGRAIPLGCWLKKGLVPEGLLEKFTFSLQTKLGFAGVLSLGLDQANAGTQFEFSGMKALPVGAIDGIRHAKDSCEKLKMGLLSFRKVLVSAVGGGGSAFAVISRQEGDELGF